MLEFARTDRVTEALPALTPVLKPSDFADISYSPALLLVTPLVAPFMHDKSYRCGCNVGFVSYFEGMVDFTEDSTATVFVDRYYTEDEVAHEIVSAICECFESSLAWRVGFVIGWLSALALTNRVLASKGLMVLSSMIDWAHMTNASRTCGGDGWPLDL